MVEQRHISERRACRLVRLSRDRDSYRQPPVLSELNAKEAGQSTELDHAVRRSMSSWSYVGTLALGLLGIYLRLEFRNTNSNF